MNKMCLYEDCKVVLGYNRALIYDLGRNNYYPIPIDLANIIIKNNRKQSIDNIIKSYPPKYKDTILEYFDFLFNNDLIFLTEEPELFPELSLDAETYHIINHIILEFSAKINIGKIITLINKLNIEEIELRVNNFSDINNILQKINFTKLTSIILVVNYSSLINNDLFKNFKKQYKKITQIIIYNSPFDSEHFLEDYKLTKISYISVPLSYFNNLILPNFFKVNTLFFSEALKYNVYFNKKIFIDNIGNIVNSMVKREKIISLDDLQLNNLEKIHTHNLLANVNKDNVSICKECEFRYMCVDNRVPVKDNKNNWYYIEECNYNPYISKWKGQNGWISIAEWQKYQTLKQNK